MLHTASVELLANATATGDWKQWPGGRGFFVVIATDFDGESVALQMLGPDGLTPVDVMDVGGNVATLSANGGVLFELPPCPIRAAVSTGGGTTVAIYARADRIPG
jgi:hypothetical protein